MNIRVLTLAAVAALVATSPSSDVAKTAPTAQRAAAAPGDRVALGYALSGVRPSGVLLAVPGGVAVSCGCRVPAGTRVYRADGAAVATVAGPADAFDQYGNARPVLLTTGP